MIELASSKIQYIGGEIHSECRREMSKIVFSMEQEAIQGPAVVHKSEALCLYTRICVSRQSISVPDQQLVVSSSCARCPSSYCTYADVAKVYKLLCSDLIWPATNRDFICQCSDDFWNSAQNAGVWKELGMGAEEDRSYKKQIYYY